ncbi:hypothetical protein J4443_00800 [Candidatus Woesearchaeota archaeon]|nr:hypothetical protein [Candidatus Woesearchaeota archaeon]
MVLKTFNLEEDVYKKFSDFCKENGISMSKQINIFIQSQIEEEPKVREEYLKKLETIRKGKFINVGTLDDFKKRYQVNAL